jgi:hypothetical protein
VKAWRVTRDDAGGQGGRGGQGDGGSSGPGFTDAPSASDDEPWPDPSSADPGDGGDDDLPF